MRALQLFVMLVVSLAPGLVAGAAAAETAGASVAVSVQFSSRTTLHVSTKLLRFDVTDSQEAPAVAVQFAAGARTHSGAEVLLSVEPICDSDGLPAAGSAQSAISFSGHGNGTLDGSLHGTSPAVAGRWFGSGWREGQLVFALHGAPSGSYTLPVRFVLSAP
jgi:hypothetical protein